MARDVPRTPGARSGPPRAPIVQMSPARTPRQEVAWVSGLADVRAMAGCQDTETHASPLTVPLSQAHSRPEFEGPLLSHGLSQNSLSLPLSLSQARGREQAAPPPGRECAPACPCRVLRKSRWLHDLSYSGTWCIPPRKTTTDQNPQDR